MSTPARTTYAWPAVGISFVLRVIALVLFLVDVVLIQSDSSNGKLVAVLLPGGLAAWVLSTIVP